MKRIGVSFTGIVDQNNCDEIFLTIVNTSYRILFPIKGGLFGEFFLIRSKSRKGQRVSYAVQILKAFEANSDIGLYKIN